MKKENEKTHVYRGGRPHRKIVDSLFLNVNPLIKQQRDPETDQEHRTADDEAHVEPERGVLGLGLGGRGRGFKVRGVRVRVQG